MKKLCVLILFGLVVAFASPRTARAVKPFQTAFKERYTKKAPEEFKKAVAEAKCFLCHVKGKPKKMRNEYGNALSKLLDRKEFTSKKIKADPEGSKKKMKAAFEKVEKMKNKAGKTWGELLKAHKLPA